MHMKIQQRKRQRPQYYVSHPQPSHAHNAHTISLWPCCCSSASRISASMSSSSSSSPAETPAVAPAAAPELRIVCGCAASTAQPRAAATPADAPPLRLLSHPSSSSSSSSH
eukprot:44729-Chlamydomonas_euryale.AAC.1